MPAFLHLFSTSWNRRWILTGHPVAQEKHVTALIPPPPLPPPWIADQSECLGTDHWKNYWGGGGWGIFDPHDFVFVIVFLVFFFFLRLCMNVFKGSLASMNFFYSIFPWYFAPFAYFSTSPPPPPTSLPPWLFWWLMVPPLKRQDHTLEPLIVYYIECARN